MTREIAVVAFAQTDHRRTSEEFSEVEMLMPVLHKALAQTGLRTTDIGSTCSGSGDYLAGRAFSFTLALDGVGAWPPIAEKAGAFDGPVDTAELHAPFSSQEVVLRKALRLHDDVRVNPSGGALAAHPVMAAGLVRIGEAAARVHRGESDRALGHATSGPCLQQNLVAVLEGDPR